MPINRDNPMWSLMYSTLRGAGPNALVSWAHIEEVTGRSRNAMRAALVRARQELEAVDGLTIVAQTKEGITLGTAA